LPAPVNGHDVTGAVFVGRGKFTADIPPNEFEKDNVRRLLGSNEVESDFKTAVLRFSDDTFERLAVQPTPDRRMRTRRSWPRSSNRGFLKETGANLSARWRCR